jgi:hypothetical protein
MRARIAVVLLVYAGAALLAWAWWLLLARQELDFLELVTAPELPAPSRAETDLVGDVEAWLRAEGY